MLHVTMYDYFLMQGNPCGHLLRRLKSLCIYETPKLKTLLSLENTAHESAIERVL
jgi:hypothetical protein